MKLTRRDTLSNDAVPVGVRRLSIEELVRVSRDGRPVASLAPEVAARMQTTADWVVETVGQIEESRGRDQRPTAYYGINTGFGVRAGRSALDSRHLTQKLGRNLIASHAVGVGPYFDEPVMRAVLLIRAQGLAQGFSGVRPLVVDTLLGMLNERVYPAVPELGSLGASGDLAPSAHLLLAMSRAPRSPVGETDLHLDAADGEAFLPWVGGATKNGHVHVTENYATGEQQIWQRATGARAMAAVGGKIELQAKEALALMNGTTFSTAIAVLAVHDAQNLLDHAELAVALTLEGIRGFRDPFYPHLHRARGHANAEQTAGRVLRYLEGSAFLDPGDLRTNPMRVPPQDPYSVRCAPQVLGTAADVLELARRWVEMDINGVTDNPLIFLDLERDYKTMSGGNFHGAPIAMAMDVVGIAMTDLGSMSDRRMFTLTNYQAGEGDAAPHALSPFLIDEPKYTEGLNSGLMMLQATAAALVSDCKTLAHPASIDSIPSSGNQEDHVSMSLNAARHARDIVKNVENILALELLCAIQAVALQLSKRENEGLRLGRGTSAAYQVLREAGIAVLTQDRVLYPDIRKVVQLVRSRALVRVAREAAPC
jgi:histidine ammonia-lyase